MGWAFELVGTVLAGDVQLGRELCPFPFHMQRKWFQECKCPLELCRECSLQHRDYYLILIRLLSVPACLYLIE